jgi:hypothetical protein
MSLERESMMTFNGRDRTLIMSRGVSSARRRPQPPQDVHGIHLAASMLLTFDMPLFGIERIQTSFG